MFDFLIQIDPRLYERYLTVERNIKSASNSFYDSYLDLQEQFVKTVLTDYQVELKPNETCGAVLKKAEVQVLFLSTLGVDDFTYSKMQDYTLKVNAHKHKGEKKLAVDTIISYLRIFYTASTAYCAKKAIPFEEYQADKIDKIFDLYAKDNAALRKKQASLREELSRMAESGTLKATDVTFLHGLLSPDEMDKLSLEDQNSELYRQISGLMEIKLDSVEEKLNRTIDLLTELTASVVENRVLSYAVGDTICGRDRFVHFIEKAKEEMKHG